MSHKHANTDWGLSETITYDVAKLAVLMDIRRELQRLNTLLHCPNFIAIPRKLDRIGRNTAKPKRKKKVAP